MRERSPGSRTWEKHGRNRHEPSRSRSPGRRERARHEKERRYSSPDRNPEGSRHSPQLDRARRSYHEHDAGRSRGDTTRSGRAPDRRDSQWQRSNHHRSRSHSPPRRYSRSPARSPDRQRRVYDRGHHYRGRSPRPSGPEAGEGPPIVGSIHPGTVLTVKPFGIFVKLKDYRRHVLVHQTQVSDEIQFSREDEDQLKIKALEYMCPPGEEVWVKVVEVNEDPSVPGSFRLHGSMKVVDQQTGQDLDPSGRMTSHTTAGPLSDDPPEEGTIHQAVVKRIEPYGVFVQLQGYRRFCLVHFTQVSNYLEFTREDTDDAKKQALGEVVRINDRVYVKVVEVQQDDRGPKISGSLKLVDQGTGEDLDPGGTRYQPRGQGEGDRQHPGRAPVGANAGNLKAPGVVDWGHLRGPDVVYGGNENRKYGLLEQEPEPQLAPKESLGPGGGEGRSLAPAGRGRGAVMPAWLTQSGGLGGSAPGSGGGARGEGKIASVADALQFMKQYNEQHTKKKKKSKKEKKEKKKKEKVKKKDKTTKHHSKQHASRDRHRKSTTSSSTSEDSH